MDVPDLFFFFDETKHTQASLLPALLKPHITQLAVELKGLDSSPLRHAKNKPCKGRESYCNTSAWKGLTNPFPNGEKLGTEASDPLCFYPRACQ